jgi:hypothetical protein
VALAPMDMRKGFNGLYAWVQTVLGGRTHFGPLVRVP